MDDRRDARAVPVTSRVHRARFPWRLQGAGAVLGSRAAWPASDVHTEQECLTRDHCQRAHVMCWICFLTLDNKFEGCASVLASDLLAKDTIHDQECLVRSHC